MVLFVYPISDRVQYIQKVDAALLFSLATPSGYAAFSLITSNWHAHAVVHRAVPSVKRQAFKRQATGVL